MSIIKKAVLATAVGTLAVRAVVMMVNAVTVPKLSPKKTSDCPDTCDFAPHNERSSGTFSGVHILIPARNEAKRIRGSVLGALAQGAESVIVLDDHSSDDTALIAREAGAEVLSGAPLPPGWTGKNWACMQLAEHALSSGNAQILVFTDADVQWHPGALAEVVKLMQAHTASLLSVFPRQRNVTLGERILTPLIDASIWGFVPMRLTARPAPVVANGQVMVFDAAEYQRIGGHQAVRGELVEDVRLMETMRDAGGRVVTALGGDAISVRMYESYKESVRGLAKSLPGLHHDSKLGMIGTLSLVTTVYTLPWFMRRSALVDAVRILGILDRTVVSFCVGRRSALDLAEGFLGPISPLMSIPVYVRALRGKLEWKGREYS